MDRGAGEFKINGVSIAYSAGTDTVSDVINRINASTAGVTASYDAINDRFLLTSKATGDMGIALEDVTGNFLAATGLAAGALTHGRNMIYTVNGSDPLISQSNTITESSSGIAGLSVTALKENSPVTVTVGSDTAKIKNAIQGFVDAYNKVQSLIDTQTASTTDAKGVVTAGILAGDSDADQIASTLRRTIYSPISGLSGTMKHLANLGIVTNGNDNNISLDDTDQLDSVLSGNLAGVKEFFSDATNGLSVSLDNYLTKTVGDDGTLVAHQNSLTKQSADIDQQIANMERIIADDKDRMTSQFVAMETAQAQMLPEVRAAATSVCDPIRDVATRSTSRWIVCGHSKPLPSPALPPCLCSIPFAICAMRASARQNSMRECVNASRTIRTAGIIFWDWRISIAVSATRWNCSMGSMTTFARRQRAPAKRKRSSALPFC